MIIVNDIKKLKASLKIIAKLHPNIAEMIRSHDSAVNKLTFPEAFLWMGTAKGGMNKNFTSRFEEIVSNLWIGLKLELGDLLLNVNRDGRPKSEFVISKTETFFAPEFLGHGGRTTVKKFLRIIKK